MKNVTYINAGAGSGKTYRLTETLTQLIKEGKVKPEEVILTTFTTKAANEFKEKAKTALFEAGMYDEATRLDHAMIGTVHSVCQRLIGKYWFELGLSPNMGVMTDDDTTFYTSQSLAELPTEKELKLMHHFAKEFTVGKEGSYGGTTSQINYDFWQDHLDSIIAYATNYEIDDFAKSQDESLNFIKKFVYPNVELTIAKTELDGALKEASDYVENSNRIRKKDEYLQAFDNLAKAPIEDSIPYYQQVLSVLDHKFGSQCDALLSRLEGLWLSQKVYDLQEPYIKLLFDLAKRWKDKFAEFKRKKNLLDFNDMEKYMRQLMENKTVAEEIFQSYRYLFVDEFQDSSPIQVKIFDALSDLMVHSYWVGDYKQSIYGFRGSDIALIKSVVDRISQKKDGCDTATLKISWRSLPDIVNVNNAVFKETFAKVLDKDNIHLEPHRTNDSNETSLRYFCSSEEEVGFHVMKLLEDGAKPNEIAVLARRTKTLATVAEGLTARGISSSCEGDSITESPIFKLVTSLLSIVDSSSDAFAKATVAILTDKEYTTAKIIEDKILHDADAAKKPEDYLTDVPLIKQLLKIRPQLRQQSVASIVESLVIELGLFDEVKRLVPDEMKSRLCLQTIIETARSYEDHCVQMNMPATIFGFISYLTNLAPAVKGDPNGVQLHTIHCSKGLQWKYVILLSLNENVANENRAINFEIFGVHSHHFVQPSIDNPYPEVYVRVTPWIYGTKKNAPAEIAGLIKTTGIFNDSYKAMLEEMKRLFYVGMTRPRDVLILGITPPTKSAPLLQWPKDVGVNISVQDVADSEDVDILHKGFKFKNMTLSVKEKDALGQYDVEDDTFGRQLDIPVPSYEKLPPRYLTPSKLHEVGTVVSSHAFGQRIPFAAEPESMATVGDCIHQIFAGIEDVRPGTPIDMGKTIESYGLGDVLRDTTAIEEAWQKLVGHLTAQHGAAVKTYHERPFRLERDGQLIVGSIDLVWQTKEGDILVDFKTCPMGPTFILNAASDFYAGKYAGQLGAYTEALQAAGETVLKRYLYYPVSGLLVEV